MTGIFCAIDTSDLSLARKWVRDLSVLPLHIKLGLQFFTAHGISGVHTLRADMPKEAKLFLDLKLHDIPHTVAGAIQSLKTCRPDFVTIHTSGGRAMMTRAVKTAREILPEMKILGVTVLTHLDGHALSDIGITEKIEDVVLKRAHLAQDCGLQGIVCSPHELEILRSRLPDDFLLVTPGIREKATTEDDQRRTMTAEKAARLGADYLVIGRPILSDPAPVGVGARLLAKIAQ